MKKLIYLTIALLISLSFFLSCTKEDDSNSKLSQKLKNLEEQLSEPKNKKTSDYDETTVQTSFNKYDNYGRNLYLGIVEVETYAIEYKKNNPNAIVDDIKPFIDEKAASLNTTNISLNEQENLLFESFIKDFNVGNTIDKAKQYEIFVRDNFSDQSDVKNFLIVLSDIKYTAFALEGDTSLGRWEACVDSCMSNIYYHYNVIDWIRFVATNPGANVLWDYASCGWHC